MKTKTAVLHPVSTKVPFILNIGLNVGDAEPKDQLEKTIKACGGVSFVTDGGYIENGEIKKERTAVVWVVLEQEEAQGYAVRLCKELKQDMIPVFNIRTQTGETYYNPEYKGEKVTFDKELFQFRA